MRIKRNEQQVYLLETALAIAVILLASFLYSFTPSIKSYYMAAVLGVLLVVAIVRFGFHRDKHYLKNYVSRIVVACLMVTFIVSFGLGLFLNFTHSSFSLNPHVILSGFLPTLLISCEVERIPICNISFVFSQSSTSSNLCGNHCSCKHSHLYEFQLFC